MEIYTPRAENLDFENPTDANKDNTYELLFTGQTFKSLVLEQQQYGGYWPKWEDSESTGNIAFNVFITVSDVASDNVGKISIVEADFFNVQTTVILIMLLSILKWLIWYSQI